MLYSKCLLAADVAAPMSVGHRVLTIESTKETS
jgi:hypothetical protein